MTVENKEANEVFLSHFNFNRDIIITTSAKEHLLNVKKILMSERSKQTIFITQAILRVVFTETTSSL